MFGALKGTLKYATAFQDSHPAHKVIVLLASDALACMVRGGHYC